MFGINTMVKSLNLFKLLLAAAALVLGLSGCGSGVSDGSTPPDGAAVQGRFIDAPVQGLGYDAETVSTGWTAREQNRQWQSVASSSDGNTLVAVVKGGQIYTSSNSGASWTARDSSRKWESVASSADGSKLVAVAYGEYIYTSDNSGVTWTQRAIDATRNWSGVASSIDGKKLVAVVDGGHIYTSIDSGKTWTPRDSPRGWFRVASSANGIKLVAVEAGGSIYTSDNSGESWIPRVSALVWMSVASSENGSQLVAGTASGRIYISSDSGATWEPRGGVGYQWRSVASSSDGTKLVAVDYYGQIHTSTDSGLNWAARESGRPWWSVSSSADGGKLVVAAIGGQIYTYNAASLTRKLTEANGKYDCTASKYVFFYLGNYGLGSVNCGEAVHVYQMVGTGGSRERGLRIARLIQSLNISGTDTQIILPDLTGIDVKALMANTMAGNDAAFTAAAASVLNEVGNKHKRTFTLVSAATAASHVSSELAKLSLREKETLCSVNTCKSDLLTLLANPAGLGGTVSGLPDGKTIELLGTLASGTQSLKISGTGTFGFPLVDILRDTSKTFTVSRIDTDPSLSCTLTNASGTLPLGGYKSVAVTCSENPTQLSVVSGTITGLATGQNLTLSVNGGMTTTFSANGEFGFFTVGTTTGLLTAGQPYAVNLVSSSPANLSCTVATSGLRESPVVFGSSINILRDTTVACNQPPAVPGPWSIGGSVSGLAAATSGQLQLAGPGLTTQTYAFTGNTAFSFAQPVANNQSYAVTVSQHPAGQVCTLSGLASGTLQANVSNLALSCTALPVTNTPTYTVGGTISGLPLMTNMTLSMMSSDFLSNQDVTGLGNGSYRFTTPVPQGSSFSIMPLAPLGYNCTVQNGYGASTVITGTVTNADISCVSTGGGAIPGSVGGSVTNNGPDSRTIVVFNGANQVSVVVDSNASANFTIPGQVAAGAAYNVSASDATTPTPFSGALSCTVSNGSGNMVALPGAVTNVSVSCQI